MNHWSNIIKFTALSLSVFILSGASSAVLFAGADELVYMGNSQAPRNNNAQQAGYNVDPLNNSNDYSNQFMPYSSFMQPPQGNPAVNQQYAGFMSQPAGGQGNPDPLMASEVSPYSKYSPYIEVIGEGSNYTLGIDDVITVIVRNQPDFSGRFVVNPEGNIQYNFVGDVKASGLTKDELRAELTERLKKFVRYPEVAVMISQYRSKAVYVFGYVNRPGKYAMKGDKITIKEAIYAAGLPRVDAATKRVYVVRPSQFTEDGVPKKKKVDVKKLLQKGQSMEDFMLEPGDTIVVDQKYFDRFVNTFSRIVGPLFQAAAVYELGYGDQDGFLN